jgi:RimJ/RimL family protein N-acetyltransferase
LIGARGLEKQFRPEGVLANHEWFMGDYVDTHFYSISRDDCYAEEWPPLLWESIETLGDVVDWIAATQAG